MTLPVRFKQDDVKRAVAGVIGAGLLVGRVEVMPDGRIVVHAGSSSAIDPQALRDDWDVELEG